MPPNNNKRLSHAWTTAVNKSHPNCCTPQFILGKFISQFCQLLGIPITSYIEGLRQNKQHMSNWSDSQSIRQQGMTRVEPHLHVDSWLSSKAAPNNKNIVDALYQLRDYLMQDSAKLSKYLSTT